MTKLQPHPEDAVAFLDLIYPTYHRTLVTINPMSQKGRPEIEGETFGVGDDLKVTRFVERAAHRGWNVYYSVNPTVGAISKKPERSDIAAVRYFQVDVDPRKPSDEDERADPASHFARERLRILRMLEDPPGGVPAPTGIVSSGGGYNGLWGLIDALLVTGENAKDRTLSADSHKGYSLWIERAFKGDHCHNVDRILRLPGSLNFPNAVKQAAGRTEVTRAELVRWSPDKFYPIAAFKKDSLTKTQSTGAPPTITVPEIVTRCADVETLDLERIPKTQDLVRRVIQDGKDAQDPTRFTDASGKFDRSRAVYFVSKQLARAWKGKLDPEDMKRDEKLVGEKIYGILTDPRFGISESILDKGASAERHALRSAERGLDGAECDELDELNCVHTIIESFGGDCVVVQEEDSQTGRTRMVVSEFAAVKKRYMNRLIKVGKKMIKGVGEVDQFVDLGSYWLSNPRRKQLKAVVFSPGKETPGYYNLWRGFAVDAVDGDCSLFLDHLRKVVCDGNETYFEYLINWMAFAVQHPDEPGQIAVVFRGEPATGKGVVAREFGKLFGRHFLHVSNAAHVVGQFNEHLRDCVVLFLDEAFFAGDVKHKSVLKTLITEPELIIEKKRYDAVMSANHLHVMMASNEGWVIPADAKERRYFVLDVPSHRRGMEHEAYWNALYRQMDEGGREALLYLLKNRDISQYQPRKFPETKALAEQKILSLSSLQEWWYRKLLDGQIHPQHARWTAPMPIDRLVNEYLIYGIKLRSRLSVATEVGRFLHKMIPGLKEQRQTLDESTDRGVVRARHRCYFMPSLESCRAAWDTEFGSTTAWQPEDDEEPYTPKGGF